MSDLTSHGGNIKLRGPRFTDFARRIGITDQTSAYQLVHLHRYRAKIISRCVDDAADAVKRGQIYRYPGWETALGWFHQTKRTQRRGRYWLTPPALWRKLDAEFHFDYDPCPNPLPKGFNSLIMEWGQRNYVNPPFSKDDVMGGRGATAFVRKAIEQQRKGKTQRHRAACLRLRDTAARGGCGDTAAWASTIPRR